MAAADYDAAVIQAWTQPLTNSQLDSYSKAVDERSEPTVVAVVGEMIVGFASVVLHSSELRAVYVSPKYARRGIGTELLTRVEEIAGDLGLTELRMDASVNAESFYLANGYQVLERVKHEPKRTGLTMACVKMWKQLEEG